MQPFWYFVAFGVVIAVVAFVVNRRHERGRTDALRRFARMRGFEFREKPERLPLGTRLFREGRRGRAHNLLSRDGMNEGALLFDYRFVRSAGQHSSVQNQTVAAFRRDGRSFPPFELRPENVLHKIGHLLGWRDIDFDNRPDFSSRYLLRGPDEAAIRRFFTPDLLAFFEKNPGWWVETENASVVVYRESRRAKPDDLATFLDEAKRIDDVLDALARGVRP